MEILFAAPLEILFVVICYNKTTWPGHKKKGQNLKKGQIQFKNGFLLHFSLCSDADASRVPVNYTFFFVFHKYFRSG